MSRKIHWHTPNERRKRKVIWCKWHIDIYPLRQKGKEYETRKSYSRIIRWAGKAGQAETSDPGQQDPQTDPQIVRRAGKAQSGGKQRPPPGGQRPSPARAPTRTSRRAGIGQGDLPHTKVTTSSLRMQGDHKEQHSSHSLNQMEGKIWSLTQTCRNANREWTLQIERHP